LISQAKVGYVSPYSFAIIYTGLGEIDTAFEWLEQACASKGSVSDLGEDRRFEILQSDFRFEPMVSRCAASGVSKDTPEPSELN